MQLVGFRNVLIQYRARLSSLVPLTGNEAVLYSFNGFTAGGPVGGLLPLDGFLYGTTRNGGVNNGVIFRFNPTNKNLLVMHNFNGTPDGTHPASQLTNVAGLLYGTTVGGGNNDPRSGSGLFDALLCSLCFSPVFAGEGPAQRAQQR